VKSRVLAKRTGRGSRREAAVTQPEAIAYIAAELERQLIVKETKQNRSQNVALRRQLEDELTHLTAAVAETGHSPALLDAIQEREKSLVVLKTEMTTTSLNPRDAAQDFYSFAIARLRDLPSLLAADVQRALAELTQHIASIEMVPVGSGRNGYYRCERDWNLLGTPDWPGQVGLVAG
jgi:hypothetical protein